MSATTPPITESATVPFIIQAPNEVDEDNSSSSNINLALLDQSINKLQVFLSLIGFVQNKSNFSAIISFIAFSLLALVVPLLIILYSFCSDCKKYEIRVFELQILVSQSIAAAISFICISHNLRKYGLKNLLFVNHHFHPHLIPHYVQKIQGFYGTLATWMIFCFVLKAAREVTRTVYLHNDSWWQSVGMLLATLVCWTYSTMLFLSGTVLFGLVGNVQVIHFEDYGKFLERDLDVSLYIEEHMRLTYYLSKISHRFRIFALFEFLVVTASQFEALLQTTGNKGIINFINAGDFAVLSIVQLVGLTLCLNAAAKISHRAQSLGSVASRWHALATCNSSDGISTNGGSLESVIPVGFVSRNYSESDLESSEYVPLSTNMLPTSRMSSFQKRQAFVTYMQSNTGGFTIFGWIVDRYLINTIFFVETSLIFFVLGKTVTITLR